MESYVRGASQTLRTRSLIKADIKQRFVKLALTAQEEQKFPIGPASAKRLGYDPHEIDSLLRFVTESFAGVGNALALGELRAGQTVLDLGCGAVPTAFSPPVESALPAR